MIFAKFTPTLTNVTTSSVTQWDYGRTLRIEGLKLPTAVRIDFGISGGQETKSRIGITKDGVTDVVIPDIFLEQPIDLVAYVYVSDTTEGKTVKTINIPVKARPKPEEYDSPESKELFAEAIEMVNAAADRAENAETSANGHADSAKESLGSTQRIAAAFGETAAQAVKDVNDAGASQVQSINTAKTNTLKAVQAEGAAQVKAIQDEGASQIEQIQIAGENIVKASAIAEQNAKNVLANAIKGSLKGEVVAADDVSSVEHEMAVKVKSKNLVDVNDMVSTIASNNFVSNEDGTYTLTKTTTNDASKRFSAYAALDIPSNTEFKISCEILEHTTANGLHFILYGTDGEAVGYPSSSEMRNKVYSFDVPIKSVRVYLLGSEADGAYVTIKNLQIELGNTSTDYTPYIDPATVNVRRCGKNLLHIRTENEQTVSGVKFVFDKEGRCTVSGTNNEANIIHVYATTSTNGIVIKKGTTVTISGLPDNRKCCLRVFTNTTTGNTIGGLQGDYYETQTITLTEDTVVQNVLVRVADGATVNAVFEPMLEIGDTATGFEPYKEPTDYIPSSDGTVSGMMSTSPNMTILTDTEGVMIDCEYIVDTKTYIDKKIAELLSAAQ